MMTRLFYAGIAITVVLFGTLFAINQDSAHALTITVDTLDDAVADDDECSLREAIENANDTTDGQPHDDCDAGDPAGEDTIAFSVTGEILLATELPAVIEDLLIDGDGEITLNGGDLVRIVSLDDGAALELAGLELTGGFADTASGAAVLVTSGALTVTGSTLDGNNADLLGGAIYVSEGAVEVDNSTFSQNNAGESGGAIFVQDGTLDVANSTFTGNTALSGGGAIGISSGAAFIANTTLGGNSGVFSGGAIHADTALEVTGGSLTGNSTEGDGGGIYATAALDVDGTTLQDNSATNGGGIWADGTIGLDDVDLNDNLASNLGGGAYIDGPATISNSLIVGNDAADGGGLYLDSSAVVALSGSTVSLNSAPASGGGIFNAGELEVQATDFNLNSAEDGGAINTTGEFAIESSDFENNSAGNGGGAIFNDGGTGPIGASTFTANSADATGGALHSVGPDMESPLILISRSTFDTNEAPEGAGIFIEDGPVELTTSTLYNNQASLNGGAIFTNGDLGIVNSTISGNTADFAGGGIWSGGATFIINTTVALNQATDGAGVFAANTGAIRLSNTIVALSNGANCDLDGDILDGGPENLTDDDSCGEGFDEHSDLLLGDLVDNGGPTLTHLPEPTSPAVDAGDDEVCPTVDQRNQPRPANIACDIGSVEVQDVPFVPIGDLFLPNLASQVDN